MTEEYDSLRILEKTGMLRFIQILVEKESCNVTEMSTAMSGSLGTVYRCIEAAEEAGLIEKKKMELFPFTVSFTLTDKGKALSVYIDPIRIVLGR